MWSVQKETGWTDDYILWEIPWASVRLKLLDAPYYRYGKGNKVKTITDEDELVRFLEQTK